MEDDKKELTAIKPNSQMVDLLKKDVPSLKPDIEENKSLKEKAKEIVDYGATVKAVEDDGLVNDITALKKDELKEGAKSSLKEERVKSKEIDIKLQQADFGVYSGIAELIGLKKALPSKTLKVLMFILQPILIIFWVVFGTLTGIVNIVMDCVNAITGRFADFTKPAQRVIIFLLIVTLAATTLYVVYYILNMFEIITL